MCRYTFLVSHKNVLIFSIKCTSVFVLKWLHIFFPQSFWKGSWSALFCTCPRGYSLVTCVPHCHTFSAVSWCSLSLCMWLVILKMFWTSLQSWKSHWGFYSIVHSYWYQIKPAGIQQNLPLSEQLIFVCLTAPNIHELRCHLKKSMFLSCLHIFPVD